MRRSIVEPKRIRRICIGYGLNIMGPKSPAGQLRRSLHVQIASERGGVFRNILRKWRSEKAVYRKYYIVTVYAVYTIIVRWNFSRIRYAGHGQNDDGEAFIKQ